LAAAVLSTFCQLTARGFEITEKSEPVVTLAQGSSGEIFCTSDEPYEFCKWSQVGKDKNCMVTSQNIEEASTCAVDDHIEWVLDANRCGIRITEASRSTDRGEYICLLGTMGYDEAVMQSEHFQVEVAVPSSVQFMEPSEDRPEDFASGQTVAVQAHQDVEFACQASGGWPEPHLSAHLGGDPEDPEASEKGFGFELEYDAERDEKGENEDGTVTLTRYFKLNAGPHDCGSYVKCVVAQVDEATGEAMGFEGSEDVTTMESRKIMVEFPPLPHAEGEETKPVMFVDADESIKVNIVFQANPPPTDNEVIWHINPSGGDAGEDSIVLQADEVIGGSDSGFGLKYEAAALAIEGHTVTAELVIHDPYPEMADWSYYLDVRTEKGEQKYSFSVIYVPHEVHPDYDDPEIGHDPDYLDGEGEDAQGLGAGVIAVIVLIVISAVLVVLVLFVAKKNNLCCFKYKQVPVKEGAADKPCDRHNSPIIKSKSATNGQNGQSEKGMNESPEKNSSGVNPSDRGVQDSPV